MKVLWRTSAYILGTFFATSAGQQLRRRYVMKGDSFATTCRRKWPNRMPVCTKTVVANSSKVLDSPGVKKNQSGDSSDPAEQEGVRHMDPCES
ncbi:hypothetical protein E2P81_ATG05873 [Venturia nashicola]|uniref:Uncharacterized protein n=1 Tax=Venturia nashicola TaxID=86259 RepID=A0A4Z1NZ28_9PEZI|nr:hypothetical protein E6O75_ATG06019 [Venturia nashicola]TLD29579.1 hypothetical protein E2P81_ATG05873 [Venturia nashicola]